MTKETSPPLSYIYGDGTGRDYTKPQGKESFIADETKAETMAYAEHSDREGALFNRAIADTVMAYAEQHPDRTIHSFTSLEDFFSYDIGDELEKNIKGIDRLSLAHLARRFVDDTTPIDQIELTMPEIIEFFEDEAEIHDIEANEAGEAAGDAFDATQALKASIEKRRKNKYTRSE